MRRIFAGDSPISSYKVALLMARSKYTDGILLEDRVAILDQARILADRYTSNQRNSLKLYSTFCDVALELLRFTGSMEAWNTAFPRLREAVYRISDPWGFTLLQRYERRVTSVQVQSEEFDGIGDAEAAELDED